MSTPKATKAQLAEALNDREATINDLQDKLRQTNGLRSHVRELEGFVESSRINLNEHNRVLREILHIHQPYVDMSGVGGFTTANQALNVKLRCTVCDTPEHHTRAEENDEMWPCATLRTFLKLSLEAIDPPANTPETSAPRSEGVSPQAETPSWQTSVEEGFTTTDIHDGIEHVWPFTEDEDGGVFWGYGHQEPSEFVAAIAQWQRHCGLTGDEVVFDQEDRVEHLWGYFDADDKFCLREPVGKESDAELFPVTRLWV